MERKRLVTRQRPRHPIYRLADPDPQVTMAPLDYSSLERAVSQLEKSFGYLHSEASVQDPDLREQFRSATIQAFEYTYELAAKMIRRQLAEIVINPAELHEMHFLNLMRLAADAGIIQDAVRFKVYREIRNITSHTYDPARADEVVSEVKNFLDDMRSLLQELRKRNVGGA